MYELILRFLIKRVNGISKLPNGLPPYQIALILDFYYQDDWTSRDPVSVDPSSLEFINYGCFYVLFYFINILEHPRFEKFHLNMYSYSTRKIVA